MIRICSDCKKFIGLKRPLLSLKKTHTLCDKCAKITLESLGKLKEV